MFSNNTKNGTLAAEYMSYECMPLFVPVDIQWNDSKFFLTIVWHMMIKIAMFVCLHSSQCNTWILFVRIEMFLLMSKSCVHLTIHNYNPFLLESKHNISCL